LAGHSLATIHFTHAGSLHEVPENEEAAKDAVQQIFLKALTELPKYQVEYLKSWLYTIARNHCLMQLRDKTRIISVTEDLNLSEPMIPKAEALEKEQTISIMEACLEELNPPQKLVSDYFTFIKKLSGNSGGYGV